MLKKVWRQRFGKAPTGEDCSCYVSRRNGNISIRGEGTEYWSKDTTANIRNFINTKIQNHLDEHERDVQEERRKIEFVEKLRRKYPNLDFDEPETGGSSYVSVDTEINGLTVTIDSDWEVQYTMVDTQRNAEKIIDFLQHNNFDLEYEDEDDD